MTTRDRIVFLTGAVATALLLLGTPYSADANSRRHVFKPADDSANVTRDVDTGGAPEIDPSTVGLGLTFVAGALAVVLAGRRRPPHS
jgi:hypothetical protein